MSHCIMDKRAKLKSTLPSFAFIQQEIDRALDNCPPDKTVSVVFNIKDGLPIEGQPFMTITLIDKVDSE